MAAGPLVLRTLADDQSFALAAFCLVCDRSVVLDTEALADNYGWDVLLEESPQADVPAVRETAGAAAGGVSVGGDARTVAQLCARWG